MTREQNRNLRRNWDTDMTYSEDRTIFREYFPFFRIDSVWRDNGTLDYYEIFPYAYA